MARVFSSIIFSTPASVCWYENPSAGEFSSFFFSATTIAASSSAAPSSRSLITPCSFIIFTNIHNMGKNTNFIQVCDIWLIFFRIFLSGYKY